MRRCIRSCFIGIVLLLTATCAAAVAQYLYPYGDEDPALTLYPYGEDEGDETLPKGDSELVNTTLARPFPFYGSADSIVYVS